MVRRPWKHPMTPRKAKPVYPSAGIVHEGSLTKYGYELDKSDEARHRALNEAEAHYGYAETVRKLAALEGVNTSHPTAHATVRSDIRYLQERHEKEG